jgi:uncharacterized protein (DUF1697 family)
MTVYIALLRGINVGGHGRMDMAELRTLCSEIGLANVQTILQSGNLVFSAATSPKGDLEKQLEQAVHERFAMSTPFFVATAPEWLAMIKDNPYPDQAAKDPSHLAVALLKEAPSKEAWALLQSAVKGPEMVMPSNHLAYIYYPEGIGKSQLTNVVIENKLKTRATARNWNTVLKLADLAAAVE